MQAPDSVQNILNQEIAAAKKKTKPGLYTKLTIFHEKLGKVVLTTKDIIEISEKLMSEFLNDLQLAPDKLGGSGTQTDPFLLRTPDDWLLAVAIFSYGKGFYYYRIGDSIIEVDRDDTYASDHGRNEAFLDEMNAIGLQLLAGILQSKDKTKLKEFLDDINNKDEAINKVLPLLFYFAKQLEAKASNPTRFDQKHNNQTKDLKRASYSEIAERHAGATDPTDDMNRLASTKLPPANDMITQITQELKRDLSDPNNILLKLSQQPGGLYGFAEKLAREFVTFIPPQRAQELNQGLNAYFLPFLKQLLPITEQLSPDNIEGCLEEKWKMVQSLGKEVPELNELLTLDFATLLQFLLNTLGNLSITPSNMAKIVAFTNALLIQEVRQLLNNNAFRTNNYLPVTLATWLLAESVRYNASYFGSLIMLDLIEAQEITSYAGEPYTFHNALRNPTSRHSFTDGYGICYGGNCKPNNLCVQCTNFKKERDDFAAKLRVLKLSELKAFVRKVRGIKDGDPLPAKESEPLINIIVKLVYESDSVADVVGGHHPMTHGNSFTEQKKRSLTPNKYVISQQKLANILMQWLCLQLRNSGLKFTLNKEYLDTPVSNHVSPCEIIDNLIKPLLTLRIKNFDLMSCDIPSVAAIVDAFCTKYGIDSCKNKVSTFSNNIFYQELKHSTELCEVYSDYLALIASLKEAQQKSQKELTDHALLFGFTCKNVPGDGRCFFHAVADQLKVKIGAKFTANQLIEIATQHIFINFELYREYMHGESEQNFLKRISKPGEWADHIMILALSRAMNINIAIIRSDGENPTIFRRALPQTIVYLGYELVSDNKGGKQGWHYQSLYQIQNVAQAPTKNINTYFTGDIDHENFCHLPIEMPMPSKPMSPLTLSLSGNAPNPTLLQSAVSNKSKPSANLLTSETRLTPPDKDTVALSMSGKL